MDTKELKKKIPELDKSFTDFYESSRDDLDPMEDNPFWLNSHILEIKHPEPGYLENYNRAIKVLCKIKGYKMFEDLEAEYFNSYKNKVLSSFGDTYSLYDFMMRRLKNRFKEYSTYLGIFRNIFLESDSEKPEIPGMVMGLYTGNIFIQESEIESFKIDKFLYKDESSYFEFTLGLLRGVSLEIADLILKLMILNGVMKQYSSNYNSSSALNKNIIMDEFELDKSEKSSSSGILFKGKYYQNATPSKDVVYNEYERLKRDFTVEIAFERLIDLINSWGYEPDHFFKTDTAQNFDKSYREWLKKQ